MVESRCVGSRLVLRFEPLVLHCECRNLETAMRVVGLARAAGMRESGVSGLHRPIAALRCSIRLEVPARLPPSFLRRASHLPCLPRFVAWGTCACYTTSWHS